MSLSEQMEYEFNAKYDYVHEANYDMNDSGDEDYGMPSLTAKVGNVLIIPSWEFRLCECAARTGNDIRHLQRK